jgi:tRNA (guanine10-N2)-methyltransferase
LNGKPSYLYEDYYPPTQPYEMENVIRDLHEFAATYLVLGGRLVYWLPTIKDEYEPKDIPQHPCLELIANSEQSFGVWSRRLITLEKIREPDHDCTSLVSDHTPAHAKFRQRYFQPNMKTSSS